MSRKRINTEISNFRKFVKNGYYFVDKSWLMQELEDRALQICLITRPRRFGKSMNLSMLHYYYEDTLDDAENQERKRLFDGMRIQEASQEVLAQQCAYPVIHLSFQEGGIDTLRGAVDGLKWQITGEYRRHAYVEACIPYQDQKDTFKRLINGAGTVEDYNKSLVFLTELLTKCHKKETVLLIDEYDVPLMAAYHNGFYDEMLAFLRPLLRSALKDNDFLELAVLTGCMRIASESIFSGMNNLTVNTILGKSLGEYFGFTQQETDEMLHYYGLAEKREEVRDWYDGYRFCNTYIYNPFSVSGYVKEALDDPDTLPSAYWANSSSNDYIRDVLHHSSGDMRAYLEALMCGERVRIRVLENINYRNLFENSAVVLNMLLFAGYLKIDQMEAARKGRYVDVVIPNKEVAEIYDTEIISWIEELCENTDFNSLYDALETENPKQIEEIITEFLENTISVRDKKEDYYRGMFTGMLAGMSGYEMRSNAESGDGFSDILLWAKKSRERLGIVIEIKYTKEENEMLAGCRSALEQIERKKYRIKLQQKKCATVRQYGVCFCGKQVRVLSGRG